MIWVTFLSLGFYVFTLRWWILFGKKNSFKDEVKENLILLIVIAAIAAVIIYINN